MTDQILFMNKLNKWFWYFGVLPLVISYLMCLNFTAEYLSIAMIERPSITLKYMGELLGFTTLGLAIIMIIWCIINAFRVHKIASKIKVSEFKTKKNIMKSSSIWFPIISVFGFIPISFMVFNNKLYFPLFSLIEPIAQDLTPYLFPVYLFLVNTLRYIFGSQSLVY